MDTRSLSSIMMTRLLTWRNPQGSEENWLERDQVIENKCEHLGKVVITELGLCLLTISSTIETIVYAVLRLLSLTLY